MINNRFKRGSKVIVGVLVIIQLSTTVNAETYSALYAPDNGGTILSIEELRDSSLVNPLRDYNFRYHGQKHGKKSVQEVKNIDGKFDYVRMEYLDNGLKVQNLSEYKYLVIHETGNPISGAGASNNFSSFTMRDENTQFIVDDTTILQAMNIYSISYAVGNTDPEKSDVYNHNTLNIEMAVNEDGNYLKTVGNTIYLVRELLKEMPHLELRQHADAWSEGRNERYTVSFQKNCPEILRGETTWWTWEKFLHYAKNEDLPVPFVDFDPTEEVNSKAENKELLNSETKDVSSDIKIEDYIDEDSIFVKEEKTEDTPLDFDRYIEINVEETVAEIKSKSKDIKLSDDELRNVIVSLNLASKIEGINPKILVELMNSYTGYFSFGGSVNRDDYNYGGLKNKKGEFIKFADANEGVISFTQYIKSLTTKSKLRLESTNTDALKTIKKKGIVKEFTDLTDALGTSEKFIENISKKILES